MGKSASAPARSSATTPRLEIGLARVVAAHAAQDDAGLEAGASQSLEHRLDRLALRKPARSVALRRKADLRVEVTELDELLLKQVHALAQLLARLEQVGREVKLLQVLVEVAAVVGHRAARMATLDDS